MFNSCSKHKMRTMKQNTCDFQLRVSEKKILFQIFLSVPNFASSHHLEIPGCARKKFCLISEPVT